MVTRMAKNKALNVWRRKVTNCGKPNTGLGKVPSIQCSTHRCICYWMHMLRETPTVKTSLWQLPIVSSVFKELNTFLKTNLCRQYGSHLSSLWRNHFYKRRIVLLCNLRCIYIFQYQRVFHHPVNQHFNNLSKAGLYQSFFKGTDLLANKLWKVSKLRSLIFVGGKTTTFSNTFFLKTVFVYSIQLRLRHSKEHIWKAFEKRLNTSEKRLYSFVIKSMWLER